MTSKISAMKEELKFGFLKKSAIKDFLKKIEKKHYRPGMAGLNSRPVKLRPIEALLALMDSYMLALAGLTGEVGKKEHLRREVDVLSWILTNLFARVKSEFLASAGYYSLAAERQRRSSMEVVKLQEQIGILDEILEE